MTTALPDDQLSTAQQMLRQVLPEDAFSRIWDAYHVAYNEFRDQNPGWQAFYTAHHQHALQAALLELANQLNLPAWKARVKEAAEWDVGEQVQTLATNEPLRQMWANSCTPPPTTPVEWLAALAAKLQAR